MSWHHIEGHDEVVERFRHAIARGRLASSFLFVGPEGVGKRAFALKLAQALLCDRRPEAALDPCQVCDACRQVAVGTHPDVDRIAKPDDKSFIPLELFLGDRESRGREGLCYNLSLKPFSGRRKIAIIDDADYLNEAGANSLLKTLEEPPPRSVLILIGTSPARQLPTIRSRCQIVRFQPLAEEVVARLLVQQGLAADDREAECRARLSEGSLRRAAELADADLLAFRQKLFEQLAAPVLPSVEFARDLSQFVEAAGKEAPPRRARLRQVMLFAADFYRARLRQLSGAAQGTDPETWQAAAMATQRVGGDPERLSEQLAGCLEAAGQVDRNANQSTLIESWLDALAR